MSIVPYEVLHMNVVCALMTRKEAKQELPSAEHLSKTMAGDIPLTNLGMVVSLVCADYVQSDKAWDRALHDALLWKKSLSNSLYLKEIKRMNPDVWALVDEVL